MALATPSIRITSNYDILTRNRQEEERQTGESGESLTPSTNQIKEISPYVKTCSELYSTVCPGSSDPF